MRHSCLALAIGMVLALFGGCAQTGTCPAEQAEVGGAPAYESVPLAAYSATTEGQVISVSTDLCDMSVQAADGSIKTVGLSSQTIVTPAGGGRGSLRDLRPSQRVRVSYRTYGNIAIAEQIDVLSGGEAQGRGGAPQAAPGPKGY